jgi:hypothetical protein
MIAIRHIASWHGRDEIALVFPGSREIPAVQSRHTGRIYFHDGAGRPRTLDIVTVERLGVEVIVLDVAFQPHRGEVGGICFRDTADLLRHLEADCGLPLPHGTVVVIGQIGGELVYGKAAPLASSDGPSP